MCTLVVAWQVFPEFPVTVVANRDERLDRPAEAPAVRDWERPVVAPIDREAGGTWIGYNDAGVLVAVTNRWVPLTGDRSRGLLVRDALSYERAEDAMRFVERELDARSYRAFNLTVVDEDACLYLEWDGGIRVRNFDPGIHVVVNVGADGRYFVPEDRPEVGKQQGDNANAVRTALRPEPAESAVEWCERATEVVADHDYGVCVHGNGFGTRSSSVIRLGKTREYEFADGPPCENQYLTVDARV